jgi:XTP/dITP diphosphohydrolase
MKELIFATQNANKVKEINEQVKGQLVVKSLAEIGYLTELAEDFETLEENARQKATFIHQNFQVNCFSEDTGLEIEALLGKPGVHTAYYSGSRNSEDNIALVLAQLEGIANRAAQFRTVIHLIYDDQHFSFEGIVRGTIAMEKSTGTEGFGYDPIFIPEGYDKPFAELPISVKKNISHRAKAMQQLLDFLNNVTA